ncbi:MAG: carbon storage regulator CsrA [Phycisphaerales bacterium]|nr:MAG: carbon storage regulator CsrA [Phycisphaerales bacterium]
MLVLSRQRDETIMIGDHIELTVVDIRGDKVRIGIKAPPEVAVHRKEVYEAIKRENEQAAGLSEKEFGSLQTSGKHRRRDQPPVPAAGRLRRRKPPPKRETA